MKKLTVIVLVLIYSLSVSGFSLQFNYCCGKLKSVSCKTTQDKKCCSNKQSCTCLKIQNADHQESAVTNSGVCKIAVLNAGVFNVERVALASQVTYFPHNYSPPEYSPHLYLLYSVFRI